MVTINLTLLVELVLFLVFLWGTARFIVPRVVDTLDERERSIQDAQTVSKIDTEISQRLEQRYAAKLTAMRRAAEDEFRLARRAAMDTHDAQLAAKRAEADIEVEHVRDTATREFEEQRDASADAAQELGAIVTRQLGLDGERT